VFIRVHWWFHCLSRREELITQARSGHCDDDVQMDLRVGVGHSPGHMPLLLELINGFSANIDISRLRRSLT
jgi:hypothetical protein